MQSTLLCKCIHLLIYKFLLYMNIIHYNNIKPTADLPDKVEYFLSAVELASFTQNKQYQITH